MLFATWMKRLKTFQKQIKETKKDTQKHRASKKIRNEDKKTPDEGLEPATLRLPVQCSPDWARGTCKSETFK